MGRLTSGQGWPWIPTAPSDTGEETLDNSLVALKRGQNIVKNRRGGRLAPTTVNSSVRTREYLTTAEIERLMAAARKSSRYGHRDATMMLIGYRHGCGRPSCAICNGRRLSWPPGGYTSAGRLAECPSDAG
jgi:hypothetical protein